MTNFLIAMVLAYLIGSIPTGYIVARAAKGIDIRDYGSGNVGATNTMRVLGKRLGALVLLVDMAKGAFCVLVLPAMFYTCNMHTSLAAFKVYIAAFAIFGHIWTIFLKFKGGKGVATTCGVFLTMAPLPALVALLIWLFVVSISKYVSLASLVMSAALPLLMLVFRQPYPYFIISLILFLLITYTHRENIKRLFSGTEAKITKKKGQGA